MAAEVTERDGVFTVRGPAWWDVNGDHDLSAYPSREEAQAIAHPWEPVEEPIFRRVPVISESGELSYSYEEVSEFVGTARSDDNYFLGVRGAGHELVSNNTMYDIAEAIEGEASGSVMYETGGSLKGGRKVWLLLRLRDPITIKGDPHGEAIPYFALQNAHDGSGAFRGQATMTRIVCDNTAQMADMEAKQRGTEFAFRHTKNIAERIEEAKAALAGWRESVQAYQLMMDALTATKIDPTMKFAFVERFIPMPGENVSSERVRNNVREAQRTWLDILDSVTCEGVDDTAAGLVHASIEYLNHGRRAHSAESLFKRNYLDRNQITAHAVKLTRELAGV